MTDNLPAAIAHFDSEQRNTFANATLCRSRGGQASGVDAQVQTLLGRKTLRVECLPDFAPDGPVAGF